MPDARLAMIVAPLLVAGSVAGFLVTGGSLSEGLGLTPAASNADAQSDGCSVPSEFAFPSDAQVETWSGDVPADAAGGTLQVQAYDGGIDVAVWDQPKYQVKVGEVDSNDNLEPTVQADSGNGTFSLAVAVENTNTRQVGPYSASITAGESPEAHVQVRVPAKAYEGLAVDTRPDRNATIHLDADVNPSVDPENGSVTFDDEKGENPVLLDGLQAGTVAAEAHDRGIAASGLDAGEVAMGTHDGGACLSASQAGSLDLATHDGDLHLADVDADEATLETHDGAISASGLETSNLTASSHDGDVSVDLVPTAAAEPGSATLDTHDGSATLTVPAGDEYGYDAVADTHDGDVTIRLPDAVVDESDDGEDDEGDAVHARTQGYEDRDIRMDLTVDTHDGDATIVGE